MLETKLLNERKGREREKRKKATCQRPIPTRLFRHVFVGDVVFSDVDYIGYRLRGCSTTKQCAIRLYSASEHRIKHTIAEGGKARASYVPCCKPISV